MLLSLKLSYEILFCKPNIQVNIHKQSKLVSKSKEDPLPESRVRKTVRKSNSEADENFMLKKSSRYKLL